MKILIAGASGFIGSHIAVHLRAAGHDVTGATRTLADARRRLPQLDWIACDFRRDRVEDWLDRLDGIDALVNCVGVLQDGLGENSRQVHVEGADALFAACERAGVRRVIHISAAGADDAAGSSYSRDKLAGEAALKARDLDWAVLRPSLVMARNTYGGTALIRSLAGLPVLTPVVGADQRFRPVMMEDVCQTVADLLAPGAPSGVSWDIGGADAMTMGDVVTEYRRWLGFGGTRIWSVPTWMARPAFWFGDLLGWLGVRTSMRTNSLKQLEYDVAGDPTEWLAWTARPPRGLREALDAAPAGLADRWHARLGFARPVARVVLGLFWLVSGLIALGVGHDAARDHLLAAGFAPVFAELVLLSTAVLDIALGLAMLLKYRVRAVAGLMIATTLAYLATLTATAPALWADPLGPAVKTFPGMALALLMAATEDER